MAAAPPQRINFPRSQLHLDSAVRGKVEGSVGVVFRRPCGAVDLLFLGVAGVEAAVATLLDFALPVPSPLWWWFLRRCLGGRASFFLEVMVVRPSLACCRGCPYADAMASLVVELLGFGSISCSGRGVTPADGRSTTMRSRFWRVDHAATPTGFVPYRPVQVNQRPSCCSSSSSPAVRRRRLRRWRIVFYSFHLGCVRHFFVSQGGFCKFGTAVHCLDASNASPMYFLFY